jgi:hypothetical protein
VHQYIKAAETRIEQTQVPAEDLTTLADPE